MDTKKFKELILYILNRVGGRANVGETVLYKLLYFCDFNYYEIYEKHLTGMTYLKQKHGPVPKNIKGIIKELINDKELELHKSTHFKYPQRKYLSYRDADLKFFTADEIKVIDTVLSDLAKKNAKTLSDYSHRDVPWIVTKYNQPINYKSVFYRTAEHSKREYDCDETTQNHAACCF